MFIVRLILNTHCLIFVRSISVTEKERKSFMTLTQNVHPMQNKLFHFNQNYSQAQPVIYMQKLRTNPLNHFTCLTKDHG